MHVSMNLLDRTILVTGLGGFIGLRFAELAKARGARVRGLELPGPAATRARALGFDVIEGDVTREKDAARACAGADVVVHAAAIVGEGGDVDAYRRVNVGGTRTTALAAKRAGVRRFVHLSSVMVFGFSYPDGVGEDGPMRGEGNAYCQTKIESEEELWRIEQPGTFDVTVIRPGDVYGPGSIPWVVRPLQLMKQGLFVLPDGGRGVINHVHVDTLGEAILLAIEKDASGPFIVSDGVATPCRDFFAPLARLTGRKIRTLPSSVLLASFAVIGPAFRLFGKEPPARPDAVRYLMRKGTYSIEKARRVLGFAPRISLEQGMRGVEDWARSEGIVA
jgi:nucleoside-diphosphate-sugar epimerase